MNNIFTEEIHMTYSIDLRFIIPDVDVGMHERFINREAPFWINDEHLLQQVPRHTRLQAAVLCAVRRKENIRKELLKRIACILWTIFNIVTHCWLETLHELLRWSSKLFNDLVPLINV